LAGGVSGAGGREGIAPVKHQAGATRDSSVSEKLNDR
jgi:hypothetical protein